MYRQGIPSPKIAAVAGAAASTVRYHLSLAMRQDADLRGAHQAALVKVPRLTSAGMRNLKHILAFFEAEERLPTTGGKTARERALGVWLHRRRRDVAAGALSATYQEALSVIPGWEAPSTRQADSESRWHRRLAEVDEHLAAGHGWPRHKGFATEQERILGVWLHVQRISHRQGKLDAAKEAKLTQALPGWRGGRARSGGRPARSDQ